MILRRHSTTRTLDEPAPTITTSGAHLGLCQPFLLGQQSGAAARAVDEPTPTIAAGGAISLIEPFLFANRTHNAPKRVEDPVPALCTGNHIALVEPELRRYGTGPRNRSRGDSPTTGTPGSATPEVTIDGRLYQVEILFRMLAPHELAQAQGFDRDDVFCGTRTDQVRQIGNAVPVGTAQALCESALA